MSREETPGSNMKSTPVLPDTENEMITKLTKEGDSSAVRQKTDSLLWMRQSPVHNWGCP